MNDTPAKLTRSQMREWLTEYVAQLLGMAQDEVDTAKSLELYGIDSSGAVGMSGDLEELLGRKFDTSLVYDYPTIDAIVDHLVSLEVVSTA